MLYDIGAAIDSHQPPQQRCGDQLFLAVPNIVLGRRLHQRMPHEYGAFALYDLIHPTLDQLLGQVFQHHRLYCKRNVHVPALDQITSPEAMQCCQHHRPAGSPCDVDQVV